MKQYLIVISFIVLCTAPLFVIGAVMIDKVNNAYLRGYQAGVDSVNMDKQCTTWFFNENLQDVKKRMCKK